MPRRIIIVENRSLRQSDILRDDMVKLDQLGVVLKSSFSIEEIQSEYDVLAIHRTYAIEKNFQEALEEMVKKGRYVVFFSGGQSETTIMNDGRSAMLGLDAFYSDNLVPFCQDVVNGTEPVQLYKLIYGVKRWRLPLLMKLRQLLWIGSDNDYFQIQSIKKELGIEEENLDAINKQIIQLCQ